MASRMQSYDTIDEYIAGYPEDTQETLQQLRAVIQSVAPEATEAISYGMPTFKLHGNLVHFAAFKDHIGFFPTSSGVERFESELTAYSTSKGTIRFPLGKPIPEELIRKITAFRVKENLERAAAKARGKKRDLG
jgi:uncharacterized protein YdhG (YjbR/CyaY superfamily)